MNNRTYIAIDLKSFYASVECIERGLDPLKTNLVVADSARTEKTICLAVSPSLKSFGISGRARLFEVVQKITEVNKSRKYNNNNKPFAGKTYFINELNNPTLEVDYIIAKPQMAKYMQVSSKVYSIYLKYIAPEDIHPYSIDEVFIDVTDYLHTYKCTAHELALKMIRDVLKETKVTATAGIGTNLYLCKIAMDIMAKKMQADKDGVRIAELDEMSYRKLLWDHTPLTDFWRVGTGYSNRLAQYYIKTMGDLAKFSLKNEEILYKEFGINAELLIDHAWGHEPVSMKDVKSYKPSTNSISSGQVLTSPYDSKKARIIVSEMTDQLTLELVDKNLITSQIVLDIGYDIESLINPEISRQYKGEISIDRYNRQVPKHSHGTINLDRKTSSTKLIVNATLDLYDKIINKKLLIRRINVTACNVIPANLKNDFHNNQEQMDLFTDYEVKKKSEEALNRKLKKENSLQKTVIKIKKKFGKNMLLKGTNFEEGSTAKDRNNQIGGHKA